eukprot:gene1785-1988_t
MVHAVERGCLGKALVGTTDIDKEWPDEAVKDHYKYMRKVLKGDLKASGEVVLILDNRGERSANAILDDHGERSAYASAAARFEMEMTQLETIEGKDCEELDNIKEFF